MVGSCADWRKGGSGRARIQLSSSFQTPNPRHCVECSGYPRFSQDSVQLYASAHELRAVAGALSAGLEDADSGKRQNAFPLAHATLHAAVLKLSQAPEASMVCSCNPARRAQLATLAVGLLSANVCSLCVSISLLAPPATHPQRRPERSVVRSSLQFRSLQQAVGCSQKRFRFTAIMAKTSHRCLCSWPARHASARARAGAALPLLETTLRRARLRCREA
eukprot:1672407-Rhodomonas_salina.1